MNGDADFVVTNRAAGAMRTRAAADVVVRQRIARLADLVGRYCPVDSLVRAAVPDYEVRWERL